MGSWYDQIVTYPLSNIIQLLENFTHDTGFAFVLIAVLINIALWNVNKKSYMDTQKMRYINPLLVIIQEKYKDNPQLLLAERSALLKKHKVSLFSSFAPILLQLPVLFSLYFIINEIVQKKDVVGIYSFINSSGVGNFTGMFLGQIPIGAHSTEYTWGFVLPLTVAILSHVQGRFMFDWAPKPNLPPPRKVLTEKQKKDIAEKKAKGETIPPDFADTLQKSLETQTKYFLPFILFLVNFNLQIGLNLYFISSTAIGIIRQVYFLHYFAKNGEEMMKDILADDPEFAKEKARLEKKSKITNMDELVTAEIKEIKKPKVKAKKKKSKK
jgi:YidC/Oxa1 family membrane protein insertase